MGSSWRCAISLPRGGFIAASLVKNQRQGEKRRKRQKPQGSTQGGSGRQPAPRGTIERVGAINRPTAPQGASQRQSGRPQPHCRTIGAAGPPKPSIYEVSGFRGPVEIERARSERRHSECSRHTVTPGHSLNGLAEALHGADFSTLEAAHEQVRERDKEAERSIEQERDISRERDDGFSL